MTGRRTCCTGRPTDGGEACLSSDGSTLGGSVCECSSTGTASTASWTTSYGTTSPSRPKRGTAQGIPPAKARRQAFATLGGLESARNGVHEVRFGAALEQIVQDVKYAFRSLSRSRGFALVGVVTVALGIGASTAVFSVVDAVLLNPLPFPQAERIVTVWQFDATAAVERAVSPGNFLEWRDRSTAFDGIATVEPSGVDIVSDGEPQNLRIWRVSEGFFDILGMRAQHGRTFTADEHQPGADGAVVLSQRFWQQRFGGDPGVVGRTLTLSERPYVVVGVMPPQFDIPPGRDLWMSRAFTEDDRQSRGAGFLFVIARLTPGVPVDAARAEIRRVAEQLAREYPATNQNVGASIIPSRDRVVGDARSYLLLLSGAIAFVLLIACVNVANLLLARGTARAQELAVRAALGAGRRRFAPNCSSKASSWPSWEACWGWSRRVGVSRRSSRWPRAIFRDLRRPGSIRRRWRLRRRFPA